MAQRNHIDDQHTDMLTSHLAVLTQAVTLAVTHLEALMQAPGVHGCERRMAEILQALTRVNERAMQHGLRKSVQGLAHEQQQVEARVAQPSREARPAPL
jgi:hypothetical protein